ncbi:hypothetical protein A2Z67_03905 [Candidatus Woesebacteria bacterium RBG_13_36_22]|uniref:Uncharacterized protein n=1 Tax=Candidatus Woesebacteria bacterium RBG_13_36_22 TaxID=1802478 RepID=A0A1F7WZS7_9BACT|nr:MAG: hypothetical protein A2Z67_03905 [Candidatus Woesebacteria bacterium RBG_13_36_22]
MSKQDNSDIEKLVEEAVELITVTPEGLALARERAAKFLVIQATLIDYLRQVDEDLAKRSTLKDATFANIISKAKGANVTEKKINVAQEEEYSKIRQSYEELEAEKEWVKNFIRIFENAHLLYRSMAREQ